MFQVTQGAVDRRTIFDCCVWFQTLAVGESYHLKKSAVQQSVYPTPVCTRTHKSDHVRTIKILYSMSVFGGLRKRENTQQAMISNS